MHQRHSPAGVMRRHRTTATPFENETVQTLLVWALMFFISPLRGKHDAKRGGDCGPTQHRRINARNGGEQQMLRLWLSGNGEAPPSRGLRVPAPHDSPVQAINPNDEIVRVSYEKDGEATCRRFHRRCFGRDAGSQQLARKASPEKTAEILAAIARKAAEAAVPSPLSFIRRPRAWLGHNAVRVHVPMLGDHVEAVFARRLHVSQSRSVSHSSSINSRWWSRSSRRWDVRLSTPSLRQSGRQHT